MHFGPEWMRPKQQPLSRPQQPPSPPPANPPPSAVSTYSALVSSVPPTQAEIHDEAHPFRYSKEELLKIYKDGGGKAGLGLEVERWEGVVREYGSDPVGLREMGEAEKKVRRLVFRSYEFVRHALKIDIMPSALRWPPQLRYS